MITRCLRWVVGAPLIVLFSGLLLPIQNVFAQNKRDLNKVPTKVMAGLKGKFPQAKIHKWTKEQEGDIVIYDFEFSQQGQKFEADIKEDGTIHNWEKAIAFTNLPEIVRKAVAEKYPNSTPLETMEITAVKNGKDELEGYEIILRTADKKQVEVMVAPDGKILEGAGA